MSSHIKNIMKFLIDGHQFDVDKKGRKYYKVPSDIRRNNRMIVSDNDIKKATDLIYKD